MRRVLAAVLSATLAACVQTAPSFTPGSPIAVEEKALGRVYKQHGERVDVSSLLSGLENVEAAREEAQFAHGWLTLGKIVAPLGGAAMGYGAGTWMNGDKVTGRAFLEVGAPVAALGILFGRVADGHLQRAVRLYNDAHTPAPTAFLVPWAGTIRSAQDQCVAAGVGGSF